MAVHAEVITYERGGEGWQFSESTVDAIGELWVAVVEARNVNDNLLLPCIALRLASAAWEIRTKHTLAKSPFSWHEQFIIAVKNANDELTVTMIEDKATGSVGKGALNLASLKDNEVNDVWIPLDSGGEVRIKARITYEHIPYLSGRRLPSFRLVVEKKTYFPGETVRGYVTYSTAIPSVVGGVSLTVKGFSHVKFREHARHPFLESKLLMINRTAVFFGHIVYKDHPVEQNKSTIPPGDHLFPFEFILPQNLPPTFHGELETGESVLANSYVMHAYVEDEAHQIDRKEALQELIIITPNDLMLSLPQSPSVPQAEEHKVRIRLELPNVIYAGETTKFRVEIDNHHHRRTIKQITADLYRITTAFAEATYDDNFQVGPKYSFIVPKKNESSVEVISMVLHKGSEKIATDTTWITESSFILPANTTPTIPLALSNQIQVRYVFKITAVSNSLFKAPQMSHFQRNVMVLHRQFTTPHIQPPKLAPVPVDKIEDDRKDQRLPDISFHSAKVNDKQIDILESMPTRRGDTFRVAFMATSEWPHHVDGEPIPVVQRETLSKRPFWLKTSQEIAVENGGQLNRSLHGHQ